MKWGKIWGHLEVCQVCSFCFISRLLKTTETAGKTWEQGVSQRLPGQQPAVSSMCLIEGLFKLDPKDPRAPLHYVTMGREDVQKGTCTIQGHYSIPAQNTSGCAYKEELDSQI